VSSLELRNKCSLKRYHNCHAAKVVGLASHHAPSAHRSNLTEEAFSGAYIGGGGYDRGSRLQKKG
jgi:hypothetical protein